LGRPPPDRIVNSAARFFYGDKPSVAHCRLGPLDPHPKTMKFSIPPGGHLRNALTQSFLRGA